MRARRRAQDPGALDQLRVQGRPAPRQLLQQIDPPLGHGLRIWTRRIGVRHLRHVVQELLPPAPQFHPVRRPRDNRCRGLIGAVIDPRVRTVLQYVESRHVNSACRLDDVARNLRVSRSYLSRLVFKETGVTFNRHLQLARMNTAARLLQESELSIKEISSGTGYEHVPSFDRQFRSHFNLTPGDFRRAVRLS